MLQFPEPPRPAKALAVSPAKDQRLPCLCAKARWISFWMQDIICSSRYTSPKSANIIRLPLLRPVLYLQLELSSCAAHNDKHAGDEEALASANRRGHGADCQQEPSTSDCRSGRGPVSRFLICVRLPPRCSPRSVQPSIAWPGGQNNHSTQSRYL